MLKVMHVLCMTTYSGAENVAITLINSLKGKVHSVYVSPDGPIRDVVIQNGMEHYPIEKANIQSIKRAIADIKPDVIHAHDFTAGTVCALAAGNVPIINHLHNNSPWIRKVGMKSVLYGMSCFRIKKILTVSDAVMNEFIFGRFFRNKSLVIGNPVDLSIIRKKAESAELNDESDVLFLGRLMPPKNPLLFVDIVNELAKRIPGLKAAVVGEGDLRREVEERICQYGIARHVKLYGFQENPYGLVKNTKVLCVPSVWEGFGLAAVEGLALGKPVVAANVGGLPKIVNNECGKLCEKEEDYVSELYVILTDEERRTKKSMAALGTAMGFNNIKQYSDAVLSTYNEIMGVR